MRRVVFCFVAACSSKSAPPAPEPVKPVPGHPTTKSSTEPPSGMHLDDDNGARLPATPPTAHPGHPIDVTLRSTPTGARAIVDGTFVGNTPAFWSGDADGREHEFSFVMTGYALARYRFVPVASGVVHARMEPIADEADAGLAPEIAPDPTPNVVVPSLAPVAPSPTVVSPPDGNPLPF